MLQIGIVKVDLRSNERKKVENFLGGFGLALDNDVEYTVCAFAGNEIAGTCSYAGKVIKCFAVRESLQGEGIAGKLITHISNEMFDRGIYETFIFTKPGNKGIFEGFGYREVQSVNDVTLLEGGRANIREYVRDMLRKSSLGESKRAALVMNCNPFTLGHRYLIERASLENEEVVVFIVEEERSLFPFDIRYELVRNGTKDLKNVHILPGGSYIISSATFPSYFLRCEDERFSAYTSLDANIFGRYIAPVFRIVKRYVGTEPYCSVTRSYNEALMRVLPEYGIDLVLIERKKAEGEAISASDVRRLIREDRMEELNKFLPDVTLEFLQSDSAYKIIEKIKRSCTPH